MFLEIGMEVCVLLKLGPPECFGGSNIWGTLGRSPIPKDSPDLCILGWTLQDSGLETQRDWRLQVIIPWHGRDVLIITKCIQDLGMVRYATAGDRPVAWILRQSNLDDGIEHWSSRTSKNQARLTLWHIGKEVEWSSNLVAFRSAFPVRWDWALLYKFGIGGCFSKFVASDPIPVGCAHLE